MDQLKSQIELQSGAVVSQSEQHIQDIPLLFSIAVILLSALAGELYRADKQQRITKTLLVRVAIRSFASAMVGVIVCLYCLHQGMDLLVVGAITGGVSMLGADVVIATMTIIFKRKLNV